MPFDFTFGIGSLLGSGISSAMSLEIAKKQMKFQERSYKHRHQWAVEDLRKAGLNPILSATGGAGGSLPGAAQPFPDLGSAVNSAVQAERTSDERKVLKETAKIKKWEANYWRYKQRNEELGTDLLATDIATRNYQMAMAHLDLLYKQWESPGRKLRYDISKGKHGDMLKWIQEGPTGGVAKGAATVGGIGFGAMSSAKGLVDTISKFKRAKALMDASKRIRQSNTRKSYKPGGNYQ